jgi:hypothetical protein
MFNTVVPTVAVKHYVLDTNTKHEAITTEMKVTVEKAA